MQRGKVFQIGVQKRVDYYLPSPKTCLSPRPPCSLNGTASHLDTEAKNLSITPNFTPPLASMVTSLQDGLVTLAPLCTAYVVPFHTELV